MSRRVGAEKEGGKNVNYEICGWKKPTKPNEGNMDKAYREQKN